MRIMKKIAVVMAAVVACVGISGCSLLEKQKKMTAEEVVNIVLTAYQQGDYESMKPYLDDKNKLHQLFGASGESAMDPVYQKVLELTKGVTFTTELLKQQNGWGEVKVKIQTNDIAAGIPDAMNEAIKKQVEEGGDSFNDVPGWLVDGLQAGEPIEEEFTIRVASVNGEKKIDSSSNRDFYEKLLGGFTEYMDLSFTTCKDVDDLYEIVADGDEIIGMVETTNDGEDASELTDEDMKLFEESFGSVNGFYIHAEPKGSEGILVRLGVNFDIASSSEMADMGIITDTPGGGRISLQTTIDSYEESGMECITDNFRPNEVTE